MDDVSVPKGQDASTRNLTIQDIPSEILTEIFRFSTFSTGPIVIPPDFSKLPWTLIHTCAQWRSLVLDTSDLWSNLHLNLRAGQNASRTMSQARTLIQRSGDRPLSISNSANLFDSTMQDKTARLIYDIIMPAARRLRALSYEGWAEGLVPLLTSPPGSLPILETIEMLVRRVSFPESLFKIRATSFQNAPHLRSAILRSRYVYYAADLILLNLPWNQLTTLRIVDIDVRVCDISQILSQCKNLANLTISEVRAPRPGWNPVDHPVILPCLTTFDVVLFTGECDTLLSTFSCPNLRHLTIQFSQSTISSSRSTDVILDAFVRRSCANVKTVSMMGETIHYILKYQRLLRRIFTVLSEIQAPVQGFAFGSRAHDVPAAIVSILDKTPPSLRYLTIQVFPGDLHNGVLDAIEAVHRKRGWKLSRVLVEGEVDEVHRERVEQLKEVGVEVVAHKEGDTILPIGGCYTVEGRV